MREFSIVVPIRNGVPYLQTLIPSLLSQKGRSEIIFIDSASSDESVKIIKNYPEITLIEIKKEEFGHGRTRDMALRETKHEFVVFLTQDALPTSKDSISTLLKSFDNERVGMAYGRQLPHPNAGPFAAHARLFNYPPQSILKSYEDRVWLGIKTPFCSNSFAAYRKSAYFEVGGFGDDIAYGEDMYIAAKMLKAGYLLHYNATSCVYHSHNYTLIEEFWRYREAGRFHAKYPWIMEEFGSASGEGIKFIQSELFYLLKNAPHLIPLSFIRNFAKWLGFRIGSL